MESRRGPLLLGLVALAASTALLCVGTSMGLWIAGRIFQGASAAVVWTVGLALVVDSVDKQSLGQFLGYIGVSLSLGTMAGPLLGGVIYQSGGYYAVFATAFALIALDVVLRLLVIERRQLAALEIGLPTRPAAASAPALASSALAPASPTAAPASSASAPASMTAAPASSPAPSSVADCSQPRRVPATWILLSSPRMLCAFYEYFILSVLLTSFDSVLPLFVHETFDWSQTGQGLVFIALSAPQLLTPLVGAFIDRYPRSRRYLASGAALGSVPLYVSLRFVTHSSTQQKILLCALLALIGLALTCLIPAVFLEINEVVEAKEKHNPDVFGKGGAMAQAYGLSNSAFAAGSVAGPFLAGFIKQSAGWPTMAWVLALTSGITGLPLLLMLGGWLGHDNY